MTGSLKERFIDDVLRQEGRKMLRRQGAAMQSALRFHTGRTFGSRQISVSDNTLTHSVQERFLDLRHLKRNGKDIRRPSKRKIHNRFAFGFYSSIASRLMHGYTEEVADALKKTFEP